MANEVHASESQALAASLPANVCLREGLAGRPLMLHSDNGAAMKGSTMFSRPRLSNDNAYTELLFRIAKYSPLWQEKPFDTLAEA